MESDQVEAAVNRAIDELQASYEHASRFLVSFMRFERELLKMPSFRHTNRYGTNWKTVEDAIGNSEFNELPKEFYELCKDAPKIRGQDGEWPQERRVEETTLAGAVKCLVTMRNNLVHSSKGDGESFRNDQLLCLGLNLLAYIDHKHIAERLRQIEDPSSNAVGFP